MKKLFTILTCLATLFWAGSLWCEGRDSESPVILVSPFHVVSSEQTATIKKGIDALLTNRLVSDTCPVRLIKDPGQPVSDAASAQTAAKTHQGDYVIYGTVVKFGATLTVDAFLFDRAQGKTTLHTHDTGEGDAVLLTHLSAFSRQVMENLADACFPRSPDKTSAPEPERTTSKQAFASVSVWESPAIKGDIAGLCVADINTDKKPEFIIARPHDLLIETFDQGKLTPLGTFTPDKDLTIVGVDCADLNQNGSPEIFVSMVRDDHISLDSLILEWDGSSLKILASDLPWVFRSQGTDPDNKPLVLVQKNKSLTSMLSGPIQRLVWTQDGYSPAATIPVPQRLTSVFSLGLSHDASGTSYATYNSGNQIETYDTAMSLTWESDEAHGGGVGYLALQDTHDSDKINRLYLEPRLVFLDLDGDRTNELISVRNHEATKHLFSGFKYYKKGRIVFFSKGALAWHPVFKTENIAGYISDLAFADTDGDHQPELIYAVVKRGKSFFSKHSGHIVVQKWTYR